ncbi:hypothetical protein D3C79_893000 [compost metagenome]
MIEVARADAHPVIDQDHFQVQETRLVFVNRHAGPEQSRVVAMAGIAHGWVIGSGPGQQQPHINAPGSSPAQGAADFPGRQKVRRGQPDPSLTTVQGRHQRLQNVPVLTGVGIGHPAHALAYGRHPWQARQTEMRSRSPGTSMAVGNPLTIE